jgi:DNA modification methylase
VPLRSSEISLVFGSSFLELLNIYAKPNAIVYDNFNGTGTTGVACIKLGLNYIGSELSEEQCKFSIERLNKVTEEMKMANVG